MIVYLSGHTGHFPICARGGAWACVIPQRFIICKRGGEQKQGLYCMSFGQVCSEILFVYIL